MDTRILVMGALTDTAGNSFHSTFTNVRMQ